jgi:hypothetical protein
LSLPWERKKKESVGPKPGETKVFEASTRRVGHPR